MRAHRTRRAAALATSALLLLALPALASALTWPTLDLSALSWQVHLSSLRLPDGLGTAILILALWGVWALYIAVLGLEVVAHLGRRPFYLRGLRPLQLLAATTLGTITAPTLAQAAPAPVVAAPAEAEAEQNEPRGAGDEAAEEDQGAVVERNRTIDDFGYDSADLSETMDQDVKSAAELIDQHGAPELPIVVTGHTDPAGDTDYNQELSERRAEAVANALRAHLGQDAVIETRAEGDRSLLEEADDAEQRRVEISYDVLVAPPEPETPSEPEEEPEPDEEAVQEGPAVGLSLPGGLVVTMSAAGAGALAGMALERRRDTAPAPEDGTAPNPNGPDTDEADTDTGSETEARLPSSPGDGAATRQVPEPATPTGEDLALIDLAQVPGLGITGPGAHGAARTLLTRALDESDHALTVVVAHPTLHRLLDQPRRLPEVPEHAPVMVTDTTEDALTLLQMQLLARHRAADDAEEDDVTALAAGPQFIVLAPAEHGVAAEVTTLLAHTSHAPIHAVLLGPWPQADGPTLALDERGTITHAEKPLEDIGGHTWYPTPATGLHQALQAHARPPAPAETGSEPDAGPADTGSDAKSVEEADADSDQTSRGEQDHPERSTPSPVDDEEELLTGVVALTVLGERITLAASGYQVKPGRRAAYEVLAYLAVHHPEGTRLEAAIEHMWPDTAPHRAVRRFHDAVSAARSACRAHLGEAATRVVLHEEDRYRLNPDLVTCDLWRVLDLLREATEQGDPTLASTAASMAGPGLVADADYFWAEEARTHLRSQIVDTLISCSRHAQSEQAASLLRQALDADPYSEKAQRSLNRMYSGHTTSGS